MSQQALDMRKSAQIVRRHKILVSAVTTVGVVAGVGYTVLNPPTVASTALVVLPQAASQNAQAATAGSAGTSSYIDTQVVVAGSDPVLTAAMPDMKPAVPLARLQHEVSVKATTNSILAITATAPNAVQAESMANAVANSYTSYVGSSRSRVGSVQAEVLQPAMVATRTSLVQNLIIFGLLGGLAGGLIGSIAALVRGREDRRLRERDEIASSIGLPVVASLLVTRPSSAEAWSRLLAEYQPGPVHAWQLRRLLRAMVGGDDGGSGFGVAGSGRGGSLTVLSLSSDRKALSIGPQLAVFAASQGIPTALVVSDPLESGDGAGSADGAAALRVACGSSGASEPNRPGELRLLTGSSSNGGPHGALLTIVVLPVDPEAGRVPATMRTGYTMLGVSAGAATAEQLARAAVLAAADRREVSGIIVADPDSDDRTTGRAPQMPRITRRGRPTRVKSMATEAGR